MTLLELQRAGPAGGQLVRTCAARPRGISALLLVDSAGELRDLLVKWQRRSGQ